MTTKIKNTIGTICGALACVSVFAAVCVMDGSAHEMAVRLIGVAGFITFTALWARLKGGEQ